MSEDRSEIDENEGLSQEVEDLEEDIIGHGSISEESSEVSASEDEASWITWFINLRGNDFFCEVDEDFIQDDFNLTGLQSLVPYYDYALDMILDVDIPIDSLSEEQQEIVETAAEVLYGLIHARYILTSRGMQRMNDKYQSADFGRCPRVYCQGQQTLPVGLSDVQRNYPVNVYCPRCQELYYPRSTKQAGLDGAYFGTTFAHMFLLSYPELIPGKPQQSYEPRIYGFRINNESVYYRQRETAEANANKMNEESGSAASEEEEEAEDGVSPVSVMEGVKHQNYISVDK